MIRRLRRAWSALMAPEVQAQAPTSEPEPPVLPRETAIKAADVPIDRGPERWFTLTYRTATRLPVVLHNLTAVEADRVILDQAAQGSDGFRKQLQPRKYSIAESQRLRAFGEL